MNLTEYILFAFSSLFVIVDPIAVVPAFIAMTPNDSPAGQLRMARLACLVAAGVLMFFALGGAFVNGHPAFIKVDISGNDPNYTFTDISANHAQKTDACYPLITAFAPGLAYDPVNKNLVGWFGGDSVVVYNPDTDSCTTLTYSGGPPSPPRPDPFGGTYPAGSQQLNGTYGRFRYFPALGMFVVINDNDLDAWLLKL